jgi:hypothetical protein
VLSIPVGFTYSTILTVGDGFTGALQQWGDTVRKGWQPPAKHADILTSHLSYWTDNGTVRVFRQKFTPEVPLVTRLCSA